VTEAMMAVAKRAFDAFSRHDIEAFLAVTDPDIEFFALTGQVKGKSGAHWEKGAYWGHEGIRKFFDDVGQVWKTLEAVPTEFRDAGDSLLVLGRLRGRSREGDYVDIAVQWVGKTRRGKLSYWCIYTDVSEALAAVELAV
jgi:ketosteroid isomerase-like protein